MDAHAHPDVAPGKAFERRGCCLEGARRSREGDEERVPLCIDLDSAVGGEGLANHAAVLGESLGVLLRTE